MQLPYILIHCLTYTIDNKEPLFHALSLSFAQKKIGLVGRNGIGKSTLLKLISGEFEPILGSIERTGTVVYCPQILECNVNSTVAQILGVAAKLQAHYRIQQGSVAEEDFVLLNDDWLIEERVNQQLQQFGLAHLSLDRLMHSLSGGEQTRLLLAKTFLAKPDFIILDEPTNNLDFTARKFLYNAISQWQGGLIVVSHDRTLLNLMDQIIELTSLGAKTYGGNYDECLQLKTTAEAAAQNVLQSRIESLAKAQEVTQLRKERHEQNEARGNKLKHTQIKAKGCYNKIELNAAKGRSESTNRRIRLQAGRKLEGIEAQLQLAKEKIEIKEVIKINLETTRVPAGKMIVDIEEVNFAYPDSKVVLNRFNLTIIGPERIALTGNNGSGKTTLIKLILGLLQPTSGKITLGTQRISYLDQAVSFLNPELSILKNFQGINPGVKDTDAHYGLAQFLFRNSTANKLVKNLSGGEKLRAGLACALMSQIPPQLLILDEPTNHLDLDSITNIELALKDYQGAMLVVSHDQKFLENIGVKKIVRIHHLLNLGT